MSKALFTYAVWTEEDTEIGESSEHGFYLPDVGKIVLFRNGDGQSEDTLEEAQRGVFNLPVMEAVRAAISRHGPNSWSLGETPYGDMHAFTKLVESEDEEGVDVVYVLFIKDVTPSTAKRITRLLT